jgi:imidazolonepropionase-like amidohydrolase
MKNSSHFRRWHLLPFIFVLAVLASCSDNTTTSSQQATGTTPAPARIAAQPAIPTSQPTSDEADLVIKGGQLIDMVDNEPTVVPIKGLVINDGTISRVVAANSNESLPTAKETIDASDRYIMPGLIDSHIHFRPWTPDASIWRRTFLYYGVTTLQDFSPCGARCKVADPNEWLVAYKELVNNSHISNGPTLYIGGIKLGGPEGPTQDHAHHLQSVDEVVPYIDNLMSLGVDFITVEAELPPEFLKIALEEGAKRRVPVTGHSHDAREVIELGQKFIEHMYSITHSMTDERLDETFFSPDYDYLMDMERAPEMIDYLIQKEVFINPTMTSRYGRLSDRAASFTSEDEAMFEFGELFSDTPEEFKPRILAAYKLAEDIDAERLGQMNEGFEKIQEFLRMLTEAGGKVVAATDTTDAKMPGLTMHRELDMLVDAGITPYRALLGATRWPAEFLYKEDLIGTIEPGKLADILILGSNPIEDISNSRDIEYVIRKGATLRTPEDCSVIEPPIAQSCQ